MAGRGAQVMVAPVLVVALSAISSAAVLARLAEGVPPLAVAFWRTAAVALLLAPALRRVSTRDALLVLAAGVCLAGHFWSWFASLAHTSVMRSTVLVCLTPVWVGLIEGVVLRHAPTRGFWPGVGLALVGVGVMAGGGASAGSLTGDGLAILGGVLSATYLVLGRSARQAVPFSTYGSMVCGVAALTLLPLAWGLDVPLSGYPQQAWMALAAMALGPQLLGHVGLNFAVRYVKASTVAALILLEPVGATVLAALVLGETPAAAEVAGGVVVLLGVGLATRA